jgi:predicted GIY-YIG superfamily endonuclease
MFEHGDIFRHGDLSIPRRQIFPIGESQMVYLIHFHTKFWHAQHYIGYCDVDRFMTRMSLHLAGKGSKLIRAINKVGIKWNCVRVWMDATRTDERRFKNYHKIARYCPVCSSKEQSPEIDFDSIEAIPY